MTLKETLKWLLTLSLVCAVLYPIVHGGYRLKVVSGSEQGCEK